MRWKTMWQAGALVAVTVAAMLSSACTPSRSTANLTAQEEGGAGPTGEAAVAEAEKVFTFRCSVCHGPQGRGDGPGGAALDPHPRNFTDPKWQASVTDEHIEKIIQYGGSAVGKSPNMPSNPDLTEKQAVVQALRAHVRSLGGK